MLENCVNFLCGLLAKIPLECMQYSFMQSALLAILFLAPLTAAAGIQVVNFRMAFFADTVGHSAFAGAALGILLLGSNGPVWTMPILSLLIGAGVLYIKNTGKHSSDTVIGVIFAFVVSLGLLLTGSRAELSRLSQQFVFGDILLITPGDTALLALLAVVYSGFICRAFNGLLLLAIDGELARAHRIKTGFYSYLHISLLALIIIFTVKLSGVLLAGAMLIVPAATARNLARCASSMFFYAIFIGLLSGITGLLIAAQSWANFPAGAAIVMVSCLFFLLSLIFRCAAGRE